MISIVRSCVYVEKKSFKIVTDHRTQRTIDVLVGVQHNCRSRVYHPSKN